VLSQCAVRDLNPEPADYSRSDLTLTVVSRFRCATKGLPSSDNCTYRLLWSSKRALSGTLGKGLDKQNGRADHSSITSGLTPSITTGIVPSMTDTDKIRENRLRRAAQRQGLMLAKSRRRDPRASDYGTYMLVDAQTNTLTAWGLPPGYGMSLDDVEDALRGEQSDLKGLV
jgi:hypothetical protein